MRLRKFENPSSKTVLRVSRDAVNFYLFSYFREKLQRCVGIAVSLIVREMSFVINSSVFPNMFSNLLE